MIVQKLRFMFLAPRQCWKMVGEYPDFTPRDRTWSLTRRPERYIRGSRSQEGRKETT
jgi:hypothetical protein